MENKNIIRKSVIAYGMGGFGRQSLYIIQNTFLLYYFVSVAGLNSAAVGIMMMLAKVWDAINDPMMGALVDNTHSKYGKVRPYILYGAVPLAICFSAMFAIPQGFSQTGKMIWATVFYVATGMLFTMVEVPSQTLLVRLTDDSSERMRLARAKSVIGTFGVILPPVVIPIIMEKVSNQWLAYAASVGVFSVLIAVTYLITFAGTKERVELNDNSHIGLFQGLKVLFSNKYYLKYTISYLVYGAASAVMNGVMMFYFVARYHKATLTTMLALIMMVGMFGASIFGKNISDRFGKAKTCIGGLCISVVGLLLRIVTGDATMLIMIVGIFCYSVGVALYMACLWPMIGDAIDYGELQSGIRPESMAFAGVTLISKIGEGISTAMMGILLGVIGYVQDAEIQTASTVLGLQHLSSTVPLVFVVIMLVILLTNDMDKKHAEYEQQLAAKRNVKI